jgi:AcrR family transcriptional regulator
MSERREDLIKKALDYFLEHGVAGLSLRPLAGEIGTSARLLVYHFGSKDALVAAVMEEVHRKIQKSFVKHIGDPAKKAPKNVMSTFWAWTIHPTNVRYLRLLFEVQVLAIQNPTTYAGYLKGTSSSWLGLIEASLPPLKESRAIATLCAAVIDGLLFEYLSTHDRRRTTDALEFFSRLMVEKIT